MKRSKREALANYLKRALAATDFKRQLDLGKAVGVGQQQISEWLSAKAIPSQKYTRALAKHLKVSELDLQRLVNDALEEESVVVRSDRDLLLAKLTKVGEFVDQYEELGHTYRSMAEDVAWLRREMGPLKDRFVQMDERLAQLEPPVPPPDPPARGPRRADPETP